MATDSPSRGATLAALACAVAGSILTFAPTYPMAWSTGNGTGTTVSTHSWYDPLLLGYAAFTPLPAALALLAGAILLAVAWVRGRGYRKLAWLFFAATALATVGLANSMTLPRLFDEGLWATLATVLMAVAGVLCLAVPRTGRRSAMHAQGASDRLGAC